jgi:hypothetical protein
MITIVVEQGDGINYGYFVRWLNYDAFWMTTEMEWIENVRSRGVEKIKYRTPNTPWGIAVDIPIQPQ